jgi:hypothetical protein
MWPSSAAGTKWQRRAERILTKLLLREPRIVVLCSLSERACSVVWCVYVHREVVNTPNKAHHNEKETYVSRHIINIPSQWKRSCTRANGVASKKQARQHDYHQVAIVCYYFSVLCFDPCPLTLPLWAVPFSAPPLSIASPRIV